ncbi:glycosyltransferase [Paenibacillus sp. YN15]|uniref:glycosyltransferase n=1 Tax=Paenibacillus sp. YN15 TaxID=1742774 RepID=UPI000DCCE7E9|nr:glycosyltransferase [Paenibacillus sp. YN15]RAU93231.1 hypothetical protein DQG13_26270 [Paenibacillus sp. YN15]
MNKVSIILLSYNSLEDTTKPCIESIYRAKNEIQFELVIVDNLSTDGTRSYLASIQDLYPNLKVILNDSNMGFAAGNNVGIHSVNSSYYILLNSDTIVVDYWLDKLIGFMENHPEVGVSGPVTNSIGNEQRIFTTSTDERDIINEGIKWAAICENDFFYTNLIGFFCVVIKKEVFDKIGLLDEGYGMGMFEDDDFCYRAKQAGFFLACVEDVFIYHKGSVSFSRLGYEITDLFYQNLNRFQTKHNLVWKTNHNPKAFLELIKHYIVTGDQNNNKVKFKVENKANVVLHYMHLDPPNPQAQIHLDQILSSDAWKAVRKLYSIRDKHKSVSLIIKGIKLVKREGLFALLKKIKNKLFKITYEERLFNQLSKKIKGKRVIIFPTPLDWNIPLFQRPQQLAKAYSKKKNTCVIYFSDKHEYDQFDIIYQVDKNLWLVDSKYIDNVNKIVPTAAETIISISWTGNMRYLDLIKHDKLIYEYIDELSLFTGYGDKMISDHNFLLRHADVTVATASKLFDDVKNIASNPILSTNAGDYDYFKRNKSSPINQELDSIIGNFDCILGYYGSLASWFDYDLVYEIAKKRPNWAWILVGWDYDGTLAESNILKRNNIFHIGPQHYTKLPGFLNAFDVATLPFKINEITLSTSPVKIFEYMAGGKPIVSSNLPECQKYQSIFKYNNSDEFVNCIEKIKKLTQTDKYWTLLEKEALENTWEQRTDQILNALYRN